MQIKDIFETRVEEKIEPVIKVSERQDEKKLASEIGTYVVTPTLERYLDDFLEHYTDTHRVPTTEIGVWISGYFGSGKSHLAKVAALLLENSKLEGVSTAKRFESRIPSGAPRYESIKRSLSRLPQCDSQVLAFNLNSLADSKATPLPTLLLSQYYMSRGYGSNFIYARIIEAELDRHGRLPDLHTATERLAKKAWTEIQKNPVFYAKTLYQAACEAAPEVFSSPEDVAQRLRNAEKGELYNVQFLVQTILDDLKLREKDIGQPCRFCFVLDESGQWIEDNAGRLAQLQALVEESAARGQGKIWIFVTTHEDMGSIYQNARALKGDMKKMEGRFRFKWSLTTENIELVLEDRIFKKKLAGSTEVKEAYNENPGVLRDLGQLAKVSQQLPECSEERFNTFYPFFPYQIHLIPEIVKSLRSAGGRGEQLSGSTRTLLAITQDILRAGRRDYLNAAVGEIVSFDEVYGNLSGEAEVNPDTRREISRIEEAIPGTSPLTRRVAEVLYLIQELPYIPRTIDNLARLLVSRTTDDLATITNQIKPELERLTKARPQLVAEIGGEYEFLAGPKREFEEEVATRVTQFKFQDRELGLSKFASTDVLGFQNIPFKGAEFAVRIHFDGTLATKDGFIDIKVFSPLSALAGTKVSDLEDMSLRPDEQETVFVLCDRIPDFDRDIDRYMAMKDAIDDWKGDPHKSEEAHKLASERESNDLERLRRKVGDGIKEGLRHAHIIFKGSSRTVSPKAGQSPGEVLRQELSTFWPTLYPKFDKVPVRIIQEQKAILDVLSGKAPGSDVKQLKLYDRSGQLNPHCPLLDEIRIYASTRQSRNERILGKDLMYRFVRPPYGWDQGAVRTGVAALVRSGTLKVLINKKSYSNPADSQLQDALRVSRNFDKVELVLEQIQVSQDVLTEVRSLLIKLLGKRKIDETPAALAAAFEVFGNNILDQADRTFLWAEPAGLRVPNDFDEAKETYEKIISLTNPMQRVNEIHAHKDDLEIYTEAVRDLATFVEKWGKAYTGMRELSGNLRVIEYRLAGNGKCQSFLDNWATAADSRTVTDANVWKDLQNAKADAELELEEMLSFWREEARTRTQDALDRLPQDLAAMKLPGEELQESLAQPLKAFTSCLDDENEVAHMASFPERANKLIDELAEAMQLERDKLESKTKPKAAKPLRQVRLADVTTSNRIQNEAQWDLIRDRLDEAVKRELAEGDEVEIG